MRHPRTRGLLKSGHRGNRFRILTKFNRQILLRGQDPLTESDPQCQEQTLAVGRRGDTLYETQTSFPIVLENAGLCLPKAWNRQSSTWATPPRDLAHPDLIHFMGHITKGMHIVIPQVLRMPSILKSAIIRPASLFSTHRKQCTTDNHTIPLKLN